MLLNYKQTTASTTSAVTNAEVQAYLKTDFSSSDSESELIDTLIGAATAMVERHTGLQLITATWKLELKSWEEYLEIWHCPLIAVSSVKYYDTNNAQQTLSSTLYQVNTSAMPGIIRFTDFPSLYDREDAIQIIYTAGFGTDADVPQPLKVAIMMMVAHLYENRQTVSTMQTYEVPQTAEYLMEPYRIIKNPTHKAICT